MCEHRSARARGYCERIAQRPVCDISPGTDGGEPATTLGGGVRNSGDYIRLSDFIRVFLLQDRLRGLRLPILLSIDREAGFYEF